MSQNDAASNPVGWLASGSPLRVFLTSEAISWTFVFKTVLAALIALWLAYRLELESPKTAVVTVFIVMQVRTGMVLGKGFYRAIGTIVGSVVSLLLVAAFSQDQVLFLISLGLWVGLLTAGASQFRSFQSYAFVLAGYTACLVGLPAALDPNHALEIAVTRLSEVLLGILIASAVSGLVFPLSIHEVIIQAALKRFSALAATAGRAIGFGIPRPEWGSLHLKAIHEIVTLDSYQSMGFFDNRKTRLQNQTLRRMSADMIAAASTLHMLNQHMLRMNHHSMDIVRETLDPLLAIGVRLFMTHKPQKLEDSRRLLLWLAEWQAEIGRHLPELRPRHETIFNAKQQLAFDTAQVLLTQFLDEFRRYGETYVALQGDHPMTTRDESFSPITGDRHKTDFTQPLIAGLRSFVTLGIVSIFWIASAWPSGVLAVTIAVVISALFSTAPNPARAVYHMWIGIALAFIAAFAFQFLVLPNLHGFTQLAFGVAPFLLFGAYLVSQPKWGVIGLGFCIFFSTLAIPDNMTVFNYASLINNSIALLLASAVAGLAFLIVMPVGNSLSRVRMLHALNKQVILACQQPLNGLRPQFERDTRELLRQVAGIPGLKPAHNSATLNRALTIHELGRAILELRRLIEQNAVENDLEQRRSKRMDLRWSALKRSSTTNIGDSITLIHTAIDTLAELYRRPERARLHEARRAFHRAEREVITSVSLDTRKTSNWRLVRIYLNLIQVLLKTLPEPKRSHISPAILKEVSENAA